MVRLKREGDEGMFVVSEIVGMFWKDVANRMSMLGVGVALLLSREMGREG